MFIKSPHLDFSTLINSLLFIYTFENAQSLVESHLEVVQNLFIDFLKSSEQLDPELRKRISSLPIESLARLVTSPYVCEQLMVARDDVAPALRLDLEQQTVRAIVAEIVRIDPSFSHPLRPLWTINGDVVLDQDLAVSFPPIKTDCGIQINYQSYMHNTGKDGIGGYSYEMGLKNKERIETAKGIIAGSSPSAHSLITEFTTIIQFRHNQRRPNVINSSTHTSIGLIRCDNFHKIHSDMPEIVDMLVHESIHQYLHLYEEQLFEFIDSKRLPKEALNERSYPSPWSGNLLDIRSYSHAILVWYGLINFWQQYLHAENFHSEVTKEQAEEKLKESLFGFLNSESVLDNLGESAKCVAKEYYLQVNQIQKTLKEKYYGSPSVQSSPNP